ncbi:MAG: radical SAM protein [Candidatus Omnitrophota bacterium]
MRILLISPPFYRLMGFYNRYFPFGAAIIGTVMQGAGHKVRVYDSDFTQNPRYLDYSRLPDKYPVYLSSFRDRDNLIWKEMREVISSFRPELVGISVFTELAASAFYIAGIVKELMPSCPVVMGGPHATVKAEEILRISPQVDYVVRGDGEEVFLELAGYLTNTDPSLPFIEGLSYRDNLLIRHNPARAAKKNLDAIPIVKRSLLINERKYASEDMGMIMASRGCPYHCSYCVSSKELRWRSVGNIMEEISIVKDRYKTVQFTFKDDSFVINRGNVEDFCARLIKSRMKINWECNVRANLIDERLLKVMKRAGCNFIKIGVESGSERMLERIDKGITLTQAREAGRILRKTGIHWTGYFLIGMVGETAGDIRKTVEFMYELRPDIALLGVYEPFPGTAMFEEGIKCGLVKPDMKLENFYTSLPNNYYKLDPGVQTDKIGKEEFVKLEKEVKDIFHMYNLSFKNVIRTALAKSMVYLKGPGALTGDLRKYIKYRRNIN